MANLHPFVVTVYRTAVFTNDRRCEKTLIVNAEDRQTAISMVGNKLSEWYCDAMLEDDRFEIYAEEPLTQEI